MSGYGTKEKLIRFAHRMNVFSIADARAAGIHHENVRRLWKNGLLEKVGRGLYTLPGRSPSKHQSLGQACKKVPKGVVCLLSALSYHQIGTQLPYEVWMAVDRKAASPVVDGPKIRLVRFSDQAMTDGIQIKVVDGMTVRVFSPAKTITDCFKYRNKIGIDVAIEALREGLKLRKCTIDELWHFAKICRVANVMRPYLEASV